MICTIIIISSLCKVPIISDLQSQRCFLQPITCKFIWLNLGRRPFTTKSYFTQLRLILNNKKKPGPKGTLSQHVRKSNTWNTILTKFHFFKLNGAVIISVELNCMKLTNWRKQTCVMIFFLFCLLFFLKCLPPSGLGPVTQLQIFDARTTWKIGYYKNKRNAGKRRHNLRQRSLVTDFVQLHFYVYWHRSPPL